MNSYRHLPAAVDFSHSNRVPGKRAQRKARRLGHAAHALPLAVGLCVALWTAPCRALDGVAVAAAQAEVAGLARVSLQWRWRQHWDPGARWRVSGYWDASLGQWRSRGAGPALVDLGFTPVFRLARHEDRGLYFEGAIGAHLLSSTWIDGARLSTAFQFGDLLGVGERFGSRGQYDLQPQLQHVSNADIKRPNPGVNFTELRFAYWLH